MGENKRYGSDLTQSAINDALLRPRPISLSEREDSEAIPRMANSSVGQTTTTVPRN